MWDPFQNARLKRLSQLQFVQMHVANMATASLVGADSFIQNLFEARYIDVAKRFPDEMAPANRPLTIH